MPLKPQYEKSKQNFIKKYGAKKGETLFWAWVNKNDYEVEAKSYFFNAEIKSVDGDVIEGYMATGDRDVYNDIITDSALDDIAKQIKGMQVTVDVEHESFSKNRGPYEKFRSKIPVAKVIESRRDEKGVWVKTLLNNASKRYEEVKGSIEGGFLHSFSFAYVPLEPIHRIIDGVKTRLLNKVGVLNLTYSGIPVNPEASFTNVALKSLADLDENANIDFDELNNVAGGNLMTEENKEPKAEVKAETEVEEEKPKVEKPVEAEETPAEGNKAEVKSLIEKLDVTQKENVELKSRIEAVEKYKEELKSVVDKVNEHDKILTSPQFKARAEQMKAILSDGKTEFDKVNAEKETESKGPVDLIR